MATKKPLRKATCAQEYEYREEWSILNGLDDQYQLSLEEHFVLYSFYVEYSMYGDQSVKHRNWVDYGWKNNSSVDNGAKEELSKVLKIYSNDSFEFTQDDDLDTQFAMLNLANGTIGDVDTERGVFAIAGESILESFFLIMFSRIRNCLAHGEFALRLNSQNEKMVVMQNHYEGNVKSRCVLKLDTLLSFAKTIDKSGLIASC